MKNILVLLSLVSLSAFADITGFNCDPSYTESDLASFYEEGNAKETERTITFVDSSGYYEFYDRGQEITEDNFTVKVSDIEESYTVKMAKEDGILGLNITYIFTATGEQDYTGKLKIYSNGGFAGTRMLGEMNCFLSED